MADELSGVVEDLREIARGVHPAILSEGRLGPGRGRDDCLHLSVRDDGEGGVDPFRGSGPDRPSRRGGGPRRVVRAQQPSGPRDAAWRAASPATPLTLTRTAILLAGIPLFRVAGSRAGCWPRRHNPDLAAKLGNMRRGPSGRNVEGSGARAVAEILAARTSLAEYEMPGTFEAVRAEALFASTLQPSGSPSPDLVRGVVATTLRRLGIGGCAARTAAEFGDHPDTAVARMCWALATVRMVYPPSSMTPAPSPRPLVFAS
jgi:hypothetical protein